jgi:esterase/lipase superfamily enzyme
VNHTRTGGWLRAIVALRLHQSLHARIADYVLQVPDSPWRSAEGMTNRSADCRASFVPSRRAAVWVSALVACLGACAHQPVMMVTPVLYKDQRLDFMTRMPPQLRTTELPVFYATTRAPAAPGDPEHYTNAPGQELRFGVAAVRLGEPGWTFDQLAASDWSSTVAKPRPGVVERVEELGSVPRAQTMSEVERQLVARIDDRLAKLNNPMVVLYIPGYRVTFDDVAVMMGSLSGYLGRGAMVAFPWPTGQKFWNYLTDCPRAERYIPDIERLVELLGETKAQHIDVIAYSCGSALLAQALARLRNLHPEADRAELARRYRIDDAIFAGSDVDLKTFARDWMPPIMDLASHTIVYYSRRDAALWFSKIVAGASRIGSPNIEELSVGELERLGSDQRFQGINVTDVRGAHEMGGIRGHGYWYANEWVANDVLVALRFSFPPEKRCLVPAARAMTLWKFPDDYPDCIGKRMLELVPSLRRTATPPAASAPPR